MYFVPDVSTVVWPVWPSPVSAVWVLASSEAWLILPGS